MKVWIVEGRVVDTRVPDKWTPVTHFSTSDSGSISGCHETKKKAKKAARKMQKAQPAVDYRVRKYKRS